MLNKVTRTLSIAPGALALALLSAVIPATADDTEIYQAEYDGGSNGGRPKVLIVFDDSGSMKTEIEQPPNYDSSASYQTSVPAGRIYWSTDETVPGSDSNNWFPASVNRCASSYDDLDDNGRFTTERARRWVDSSVEGEDCSYQCPDGTVLYDPPGGGTNPACYVEITTSNPVEKLVYERELASFFGFLYCPSGLTDVDTGSSRACYRRDTSSNSILGWVYRGNDSGGSCASGYTLLRIRSGFSSETGCYESKTEPETTEDLEMQYSSAQEYVCEDTTLIPGTWQSLSNIEHDPTHVECRDDVTYGVTGNGSGQSAGYPQNNVANGSEYGTSVDNSVDWGDSAYNFFTSHYLNWYHDDSLEPETKSRLEIAQEVITTIIDTNENIDFGLAEFNYDSGGRITRRIIADPNMTETERDTKRNELINLVNLTSHAGSTPMCESMYEAYRYIAGLGLVYGNDALSGSDSRGVYDVSPKDSAAESNGTYNSPNTDCAFTYIILMTDGEPQRDTDANQRIKDLTGKDCEVYDSADSGGRTENCLPQLTEYMANTDLDGDDTNGDQYGITYTIGFATNQQLLIDAAEKGKGEYYTAQNAQELTAAFQGAIVGILSRATTFTSPAVAVDTFTRTQSRDEVFYAMFKPDDTVDWIGNIKKLKLNSDGVLVDAVPSAALDPDTGLIKDSARTFWSAAEDGSKVEEGGVGQLLAERDPDTRILYSNTGNNGALEVFNTTNFDAAALGLTDAQYFSLLGSPDQTAASKQINWARGADAYDLDGDNNVTESRGWKLGDILHSQPLVLNYGARGSFTTTAPDLRLLVGSNSGFVHFFGNSDGIEDWAFFPKELAGILPLRRRNAVSNNHVYGMDLTPTAYTYDSNKDGTLDSGDGDKVWAYLGMRRGGRAYYALDLSDPDSPSFMWRIDKNTTGFGELGQTWSEPVVTTIPGYVDGTTGVRKPVLIFGAGYDTGKDAGGVGNIDSEGRGLFIVDAETGALIWSVTPALNSATNLNEPGLLHSVPGGVTLLDSNGDQLTDRIYFGDTGGNLWRVDLPGNALPTSSQDTWQINKLAAFNGGTTATDRRIFNAPDVVRIRQGGQAIDAIIIGTGDRTNPNATDVDNRVYLIRDRATAVYATVRPTTSECSAPGFYDFRCSLPLKESNLYDISDNAIITGTDSERAVAIAELSSADGWRFDLANAGEKSLARTITINGRAFIPTFTPSNLLSDINTCEPLSGTGLMYVMDIYTGDRNYINLGPIIPDTPSLHFSEDGTIRILLPPGAPASSLDEPGEIDCEGGVCDVNESLRPPYGNFWFQEDYQ